MSRTAWLTSSVSRSTRRRSTACLEPSSFFRQLACCSRRTWPRIKRITSTRIIGREICPLCLSSHYLNHVVCEPSHNSTSRAAFTEASYDPHTVAYTSVCDARSKLEADITADISTEGHHCKYEISNCAHCFGSKEVTHLLA